MSGEENLTIKERMAVVTQSLDDYERSCGLPTHQAPCDEQELQSYFNMNRDHIEKLSAEDCSQIAYRLSLVSFYMQRCLNRENSRKAWATANLSEVIGKEAGSFDKFTKHEVKVALITANNSYARGLADVISYAEQRVQRLTFLATSIKNLSDVMLANQRSKSYGSKS
jgi:hypothetical protein